MKDKTAGRRERDGEPADDERKTEKGGIVDPLRRYAPFVLVALALAGIVLFITQPVLLFGAAKETNEAAAVFAFRSQQQAAAVDKSGRMQVLMAQKNMFEQKMTANNQLAQANKQTYMELFPKQNPDKVRSDGKDDDDTAPGSFNAAFLSKSELETAKRKMLALQNQYRDENISLQAQWQSVVAEMNAL